jgi:hypothetical protein
MKGPQVLDGEDGLQIWRIAAKILDNQSHTAYEGSFSGLRVGQWINNFFSL